jgi:hypothetical protein
MIIHNEIKNPLWKKMICHCAHDGNPEHDHPFVSCNHCKAEICEASIPKESFFITENKIVDGNITNEKIKREVKEITLFNCSSTDMCLGWSF